MHVPENLLQLYVENGPLALIQFDTDWRVVAWSERATAMFGWVERDVAGKTLDEFGFVHEDDRADVNEIFRAIARGPEHWRAHKQAKRRITALENELGAARAEQAIRPATATMLPNK